MLPGIYSKKIIPDLKNILDQGKKDLQSLLQTSLDIRSVSRKEWRQMDSDSLSHFNINRQEDWEKIKKNADFILLDVREEKEWKMGYIPGAIHLPLKLLKRDVEKLLPDKTVPVVAY